MALTKLRQAVVNECEWGVKNTTAIHYDQIRPTPNAKWKTHTLPITTDCSGADEAIHYTVGAPDPSGLNYSGQGNTSTIYDNSEHVPLSELEPADHIVCFKGTESEHVYIVCGKLAGGDYKLFTHGDESCPKFENLSAVSAYWNSIGSMVGCRTLPLEDTPNYTWTVLTGHRVIGRTKHPVRWAIRHPRAFRRFHGVRFRRDVV